MGGAANIANTIGIIVKGYSCIMNFQYNITPSTPSHNLLQSCIDRSLKIQSEDDWTN